MTFLTMIYNNTKKFRRKLYNKNGSKNAVNTRKLSEKFYK